MGVRSALGVVTFTGIFVCGCSIIPDLPSDYDLPMRPILIQTVCELRDAFFDLDASKYDSFDARGWLIAITLTPKMNTDVSASAGMASKSRSISSPRYLSTFGINAPGTGAEIKGHKDGSVSFNVHSADLLNEKKFPVDCSLDLDRRVDLARNLGVKDWLMRAAYASDTGVGKLAVVDKPTFQSEIYTKFNANGTYTYVFPFGNLFGSLAGSYDRDEILGLVLTPYHPEKVISVRTLPKGDDFETNGRAKISSNVLVRAQERLDTLQLLQALQNLRSAN